MAGKSHHKPFSKSNVGNQFVVTNARQTGEILYVSFRGNPSFMRRLGNDVR